MNAFELLKTDHRKVEEIFSQIEKAEEGDTDKLERLFAELKKNLDVHAHIEETVLYPVIKKEAETREITLEGFEEHHVMKLLLRELDNMKTGTEQWMAKLKVLKENVEHHVEEEEDEMFSKAREVLSDEQISQIGMQLKEEKQREEEALASSAGA